MAVHRLGVELELQLPTYAQPQQCGIWASSGTYTTVHGNAGSLTYWVGPGIKPKSAWILVKFVSAEPPRGLPESFFWACWMRKINSSPLYFCVSSKQAECRSQAFCKGQLRMVLIYCSFEFVPGIFHHSLSHHLSKRKPWCHGVYKRSPNIASWGVPLSQWRQARPSDLLWPRQCEEK